MVVPEFGVRGYLTAYDANSGDKVCAFLYRAKPK